MDQACRPSRQSVGLEVGNAAADGGGEYCAVDQVRSDRLTADDLLQQLEGTSGRVIAIRRGLSSVEFLRRRCWRGARCWLVPLRHSSVSSSHQSLSRLSVRLSRFSSLGSRPSLSAASFLLKRTFSI